MKKCLRCNAEMIENLELIIKHSGMKIAVSEKGTFFTRNPLTDIKLAVCPECGYTETYVQDTTTIKKLLKK